MSPPSRVLPSCPNVCTTMSQVAPAIPARVQSHDPHSGEVISDSQGAETKGWEGESGSQVVTAHRDVPKLHWQ